MKLLLPFLLLCSLLVAQAQDVNKIILEGIAFHDVGDYDKAIEKYVEAIKLDPQNGIAYYEASFSYHLKKDYKNALDMSEKAIEFSEGETRQQAIMTRGSILDDMGDSNGALKVYEDALKTYPDYYLLWFNYGLTLHRLKRLEDAEKAYIKALTNNFSHPGTHRQLGDLNASLNKKATAAFCFYFFLLLENNSNRSQESVTKLLNLMYGSGDASESNQIYINADALGNNSPLGSLELYFNMLGIIGDEIEKKTGEKRTPQQKFVSDTETLFKTYKELINKKPAKKTKRKKQESDFNFYDATYGLFFASLYDSKFTESFCYHIMKSKNDPEVEKWMNDNKEAVDRFYLWVKEQ